MSRSPPKASPALHRGSTPAVSLPVLFALTVMLPPPPR